MDNTIKPIVFIATPIAGFADKNEYNAFRSKIKALNRKISKKINVISEILKVSDVSGYDSPSLSASQDFANIEDSSYFILIYPQKIPTSALVELGYALALKRKILILSTSQEILPYMLKELDKVYDNVKISYFPFNWDGVEDIIYSFINDKEKYTH